MNNKEIKDVLDKEKDRLYEELCEVFPSFFYKKLYLFKFKDFHETVDFINSEIILSSYLKNMPKKESQKYTSEQDRFLLTMFLSK